MEIDFDDSSYFYYLDGDGRIVDKVWCPSFWKEEV